MNLSSRGRADLEDMRAPLAAALAVTIYRMRAARRRVTVSAA